MLFQNPYFQMSSDRRSKSPLYVIPGTVTVPHDAKTSILTAVAVFLSLVPWVVVIGSFFAPFIYETPGVKTHATILLGLLFINELGLKPWLKHGRPPTSRLHSSGMPSSHSLESICTAAALCLSFCTHPPVCDSTRPTIFSLPRPINLSHEAFMKSFQGAVISPATTAVAVALMLAVPWARVRVGDHTVAQVVAGSVLGAFTTIFFSPIVFCFYK